MKSLQYSLIAAILCVASAALAEPLIVGAGIDKAAADMKAKKYDDSALQMGASDESNALKFWQIDEGTLIAVYSKKERKITQLSFRLSDERARSVRKEFTFSVTSFDPDTGVMILQTKKPEKE